MATCEDLADLHHLLENRGGDDALQGSLSALEWVVNEECNSPMLANQLTRHSSILKRAREEMQQATSKVRSLHRSRCGPPFSAQPPSRTRHVSPPLSARPDTRKRSSKMNVWERLHSNSRPSPRAKPTIASPRAKTNSSSPRTPRTPRRSHRDKGKLV